MNDDAQSERNISETKLSLENFKYLWMDQLKKLAIIDDRMRDNARKSQQARDLYALHGIVFEEDE